MDRKTFFDSIRLSLGAPKQSQVDGYNAILDAWEASGYSDIRWLAYMLATAWHETAKTMQPIAEYGHGKGRAYGVPDKTTGKVYYGRGYVQLTWLSNYEKMTPVTGVDLVHDPELALRPDVASKIMFYGMTHGTFTGKKLSTYFDSISEDPEGARRIINGTDQATTIAGYYRTFIKALKEAKADSSVKVVPTAPGSAATLPVSPTQPPIKAPLPSPPKTIDKAPAPTPAPAKKGFWRRFLDALITNQKRAA